MSNLKSPGPSGLHVAQRHFSLFGCRNLFRISGTSQKHSLVPRVPDNLQKWEQWPNIQILQQCVSSCAKIVSSHTCCLFLVHTEGTSWIVFERRLRCSSHSCLLFCFVLFLISLTLQQVGPMSILVGPWQIFNPWNLSCSATGTHSESLWETLRPTYICMCIFIIPRRAFGFECCAMVEFVNNDENITFCGNFFNLIHLRKWFS